MDVLVGATFSIDVSSYHVPSPPQDGHHNHHSHRHGHGRLYVKQEASSDSSSSIGAPDDSEDDLKGDNGDGDEVESKFNGGGVGGLGSLGSMEESLPIKRGLSNYYSGKSKSFASLAEVNSSVSSVKEVEKRDNPINKRRRVLIASKWSRKSSSSSLYSWPNPKSMPLLALHEDHEEEDENNEQHEHDENPSDPSSSDDKEEQERRGRTPKKLLDRRLKSLKSRSCYCLSDLQET